MGYFKRREHRNCADFILRSLFDKAPGHDLFLTKADWMEPNIPALSMDEISTKSGRFNLTEMKRAIRALQDSEQITVINTGNPVKPEDPQRPITLILTLKGRDAFLEDHYKILNKKDFLESFELSAKWILPVLSLIISVLALIIAIARK